MEKDRVYKVAIEVTDQKIGKVCDLMRALRPKLPEDVGMYETGHPLGVGEKPTIPGGGIRIVATYTLIYSTTSWLEVMGIETLSKQLGFSCRY